MRYENGKRIAPKVNGSFRCSAELKQELVNQAKSAGMDPSEFYEMLLTNAIKYKEDNRKLRIELAKAEASLSSLAIQGTGDKNSLIKELEMSRAENKNLQDQFIALQNSISIALKDPHLLEIYEHVKGKTNTVERSDGTKFRITYNLPIDVIRVMIHSFDFKK